MWLVQNRNITPGFIQNNIDTLSELELPHVGIWIDKAGKIHGIKEVLSPGTSYVVRSGTKIINRIKEATTLQEIIGGDISADSDFLCQSQQILKTLQAGVFFNQQKFSFDYYLNLDLPLLNSDSQFLWYGDNLEKKFTVDTFIKPSLDNKFFTGGIIPAGMTLKDFVTHQGCMDYPDDQLLVAAPTKNIDAEYRFFIVDGEVVTYSGYRFASQARLFTEVPKDAILAAKGYSSLYQPSEVFVMDIAQTGDSYEIIEYNCWNGSALYLSDSKKLFLTVDSLVKSKIQEPELPREAFKEGIVRALKI